MVLIPAGPFTMGTDALLAYEECQKLLRGERCQVEWFADEEPVHTVYLDAFYMDRHEVSNQQFVQFLNEMGNQLEGGVPWYDVADEEAQITLSGQTFVSWPGWEDYPANEVSWYGAKAYCEWRGGRLPTEAEWEKAARGSEDARLYPWGDTYADTRANLCDLNCEELWANDNYDDGFGKTSPIGAYPDGVTPYGLFDMAGNVFEWVADWYDPEYYLISPEDNPTGPTTGERRVARGGSWYRNGRSIRLSYRFSFASDETLNDVGIRCATTP